MHVNRRGEDVIGVTASRIVFHKESFSSESKRELALLGM
jgi:hypothetical protein